MISGGVAMICNNLEGVMPRLVIHVLSDLPHLVIELTSFLIKTLPRFMIFFDAL